MEHSTLEPTPSHRPDHETEPPTLPAPRAEQPVPTSISAVPYTEPKKATPRLLTATPADLIFIDSLQKKFAKSVGFLPRAALTANLESGNVNLAMENDDPAGYLLVRPRLSWQPLLASIIQACVAMDAQRRHHGLALLLQVEQRARAAGQVGIQACCAIGVEANEFWQAAGFKPIAHMTPQTKSGREVICWRKPLVRSLPLWFTDLPARAGHRCRVPEMNRNSNRKAPEQAFAEKFLTGRLLNAGDPNRQDSGVILSTSQRGQQIINGGRDAIISGH